MNFTMDDSPSEDVINEIRTGLTQYNAPFLDNIPHSKIAYYATEDNKKIGGVIAEIWGNWLLIKFLWVDSEFRANKLGSQLLKGLEEYAQLKGCHSSLVDTLSFQARPFYEKHGYQCQMVLDNYPLNTSLSFLTKPLIHD